MTKFVYRGKDRTVETINRKAKQSGGSYDSYLSPDVTFYKPKDGECSIRIMPPTWLDDEDLIEKWGDNWDISIYVHYGVGGDNAAYLCLDKMKGKPCPVCEAQADATDDEERYALKPSLRPLCYVIDRDNEKAGPVPWPMPLTLFREINARSVDKKTNTPILIDDPDDGFDVVFNRTGTGLKTKYTGVEVVRDPSPLNDNAKIQERWLSFAQAHSLPDLLNFYEEDHIRKVLFGKATSKPKDEEEDEAPPPSRSRKAAPEPEDDEAEAPVPASRRAKAAPEPEEDDVPFEPDPPKSSRRRAILDEGDEEAPEKDSTVASARRSLERLKTRSRAS